MDHAAATRLFVRHTLIAIGLVALALFVWRISYALFLAFGGVLFAVFLRGLAGKVQEWTRLAMGWSLAIVSVVLISTTGGALVLIGPAIAAELGQLRDTLSQALEQVRGYLEQTPWGAQALEVVQQRAQEQGGTLLATLAQLVRGAFDAVAALVLVLFVGLYLAFSPRAYVEGVVALAPKARQPRLREVLTTTGNALWQFLLGQFVVMIVVGTLTAIGLLAIGVPLALALGLIAGLLEFIPFLGPFLAAIPVLLVALTVDPATALYAALLFLGIQQIEGNLLTPLVERKAVSLPPVLLIVATIAFALLFGLLGLIFAAPLLVVAIVFVKMLYMEDVLGQKVDVPGA